jgi:hypothetical protein
MERELDEAGNRTAYFLAVHSGKPGFVLKTEHLKTSADTALYCSTQHLNGHSVLHTVRSIVGAGNLPTHFYWRGFRMYRSHTHRHSQSRSRTAATPTITLRVIIRTGPLLRPNSIIPAAPGS